MDKAKTNLGHGQRLDKLWTKFGQTLDKYWTLRPEFVRTPILQESQNKDELNCKTKQEDRTFEVLKKQYNVQFQKFHCKRY